MLRYITFILALLGVVVHSHRASADPITVSRTPEIKFYADYIGQCNSKFEVGPVSQSDDGVFLIVTPKTISRLNYQCQCNVSGRKIDVLRGVGASMANQKRELIQSVIVVFGKSLSFNFPRHYLVDIEANYLVIAKCDV